MKKYLAILLVLMLAFALVACTKAPATVDPEPAVVDPEPAVVDPDPEPKPVADPEPEPEPAAEAAYAPYALQFKNKTGVNITGLYLYKTGAEDKGNSLCPELWMDADADKEASMIYVYVVREADATHELYVEWEDGTNATLPDLTISNHDKFSMKGGVDPAGWEHEPMDDDEEIAEADALVEAGKTSDNFYGDYALLGLEIKNKTGSTIVGWYIYEAGADYTKYGNMIGNVMIYADAGDEDDPDAVRDLTWIPLEGPWITNPSPYIFTYFIRPVAEYYEVYVEFEDGTSMILPDIDLFTPNADGFRVNELSMKGVTDLDTVPKYDDGDPEPLQYIEHAIKKGTPGDGWYPKF